VAQARSVVDQIVSLAGTNDRRLADLYADDAVLREKHRFENGKVGEVTMPAPRYKATIRGRAARGPKGAAVVKYNNCEYAEQGSRVVVGCDVAEGADEARHTERLIVGPNSEGKWVIFEQYWDRSH
jgi:hypothetical protein